jgi:hypothetical protein
MSISKALAVSLLLGSLTSVVGCAAQEEQGAAEEADSEGRHEVVQSALFLDANCPIEVNGVTYYKSPGTELEGLTCTQGRWWSAASKKFYTAIVY